MHHLDQNYQYEHEHEHEYEHEQSHFYQQPNQQPQQYQQHPKSSEVQKPSVNLNFNVNNNNHVQSNLNMVAVTGSQQNMDMCFNSQVCWFNYFIYRVNTEFASQFFVTPKEASTHKCTAKKIISFQTYQLEN